VLTFPQPARQFKVYPPCDREEAATFVSPGYNRLLRRSPVKLLTLLLLAICLTAPVPAAGQGQRDNWPHPPDAADKSSTTASSVSTARKVQTNAVELQREARELLDLSQSLQPDFAHVAHGVLPKDTMDKLKRIERLSKHLRGELGQ
jgi:hypothetical protein